jgi:hypothetical protein
VVAAIFLIDCAGCEEGKHKITMSEWTAVTHRHHRHTDADTDTDTDTDKAHTHRQDTCTQTHAQTDTHLDTATDTDTDTDTDTHTDTGTQGCQQESEPRETDNEVGTSEAMSTSTQDQQETRPQSKNEMALAHTHVNTRDKQRRAAQAIAGDAEMKRDEGRQEQVLPTQQEACGVCLSQVRNGTRHARGRKHIQRNSPGSGTPGRPEVDPLKSPAVGGVHASKREGDDEAREEVGVSVMMSIER